ncbi:type II secretion system GspH family protein [Patescibacteria group bacterium]|nr:type II secretion system GspH family protein [Patescibacteria group bacterium]
MFINRQNKKNGFTLVEMILVVVIIGILAGIVINIINIPRTQARSRDSRRIGDVKRIQVALESYFSTYRSYPSSGGSWMPSATLYTTNLTGYISDMPKDPRGGVAENNCFLSPSNLDYYYYSDGSAYILGATMETDTYAEGSNCIQADVPNCGSIISCNSNSHCYCVQNPL